MVIKCFADQIYVHGWIHSDPHPGNLMARKLANGKTQIVLLDHGLYRSFPNPHRKWYCKLWKAIILRDQDKIEKYGRKLGAGDYYKIFALVLSFRPPSKYAPSQMQSYPFYL